MRQIFFIVTPVTWALLLSIPMAASATEWHVPGDFSTIQDAIDSSDVVNGDSIRVGPGDHRGATITKKVTIHGSLSSVIVDGPKPWKDRSFRAGFLFRGPKAENGSGTTIHHLKFENLDFPIFASQKGAVVSDVKIHDCLIVNAIQGITMWHADYWEVRNNQIVDLRAQGGGGIGILVGSHSGDDSFENSVMENEIYGTVAVHPEEKGGYSAVGIYLVSDHRGRRTGGLVEGNLVARNEIELESDAPHLIRVVAMELEDTRNNSARYSVTENQVKSNLIEAMDDLQPLILTIPPVLSNPVNKIEKNRFIKD
ncbi:MAG: hypothetical protein GY854_27405 [Deltaproteobacteria bacterium]|nr:hypothetical protein [Deltaproteobacteria bacterium]